MEEDEAAFLQVDWLPKELSAKEAEPQENVYLLTFDVILNILYEVPISLLTRETWRVDSFIFDFLFFFHLSKNIKEK